MLGREITTEVQALDAAKGWRRRFRQYDPLGRPKHVSPPYFSTDTAPSCAGSNKCTTYAYDAFFTQEIVTRPGGGTVRTDRSGSAGRTTVDVTEQTFNPSATLRKRTKFDVLGRAVETVDGYGGTDAVTTTYAYDAQGSLDRVTVDGDEVAGMVHDVLGRRTNLTDASLGAWTFEHDALSRLALTTDAKGQKTKYAYDALDRLKERRDCHAGCTPLVTNTWSWDATNATGELSSRTNGPVHADLHVPRQRRQAEERGYERERGRRADGELHADLGYDAQARLSTVDPQRRGHVRVRLRRPRPPHGDPPRRDGAAGVRGHGRVRQQHGGVVQRQLVQDRAHVRRVDRAAVDGEHRPSATPKAVQDLEYKWREDGSLHQRIDRRGTSAASDDRTDTFTMDGLQRVERQATAGGAARTLDFDYDGHGNLKTKTSSVTGDLDATAYTWTTGKPRRLTR